MEHTHILRETDIFYELSQEQLERIAAICEERTYQLGTFIFHENTASDEVYIIAEGQVDIQVDPQTLGIEVEEGPGPGTIATLQRGQVFGEVALVDQGLRSASAKCASKYARLLAFKREDIIKLCQADYHLGYLVMRNVAADLAFKIRSTDLMVREQLLWRPGTQEND
jgi:CRP/FNR family cyclic AMP-dependent transcriptional regulator